MNIGFDPNDADAYNNRGNFYGNTGIIRILIAVSILWVIFTRIAIYQYGETITVKNNLTDWLLSTSPVWVGWGIRWIRKGFDKDKAKEKKNQSDNHG